MSLPLLLSFLTVKVRLEFRIESSALDFAYENGFDTAYIREDPLEKLQSI